MPIFKRRDLNPIEGALESLEIIETIAEFMLVREIKPLVHLVEALLNVSFAGGIGAGVVVLAELVFFGHIMIWPVMLGIILPAIAINWPLMSLYLIVLKEGQDLLIDEIDYYVPFNRKAYKNLMRVLDVELNYDAILRWCRIEQEAFETALVSLATERNSTMSGK
ncbi:hypothetical protein BJI67_15905 (plasmid) [Acidihalobacter aeolianus]|uniref:Uncharacterized protein n=1 Tax=Acidihalobacter aeolianus TaxID=2792603 RepID=A0A1D8KCN9_9GAMM|nr:hypothetical protein [Acidihalobacter aeolianus]AOV18727.1 hypothetical protein BJI67_15905 [Acidihalobacter aeolianus]